MGQIQRRKLMVAEGVGIVVPACLGLTAIEPGIASSEMYERADRMLYDAKSAGRNCVLVAA